MSSPRKKKSTADIQGGLSSASSGDSLSEFDLSASSDSDIFITHGGTRDDAEESEYFTPRGETPPPLPQAPPLPAEVEDDLEDIKDDLRERWRIAVLKRDTSHISPQAAQLVLNQTKIDFEKKTGKVFDCYIRHCPMDKKTAKTDTSELDDFMNELKDIQTKMQEGDKPRRIQLMLNLGGAHWTALDFEVSKDNIKALAMDAVQYFTMGAELECLKKHIPEENIYVAYGPKQTERLQKHYTCYMFAEELLLQTALQDDIFKNLEERSTQGAGFAKQVTEVVPQAKICRWTSLTAKMSEMSELLSRSHKLWLLRNREHPDAAYYEKEARRGVITDSDGGEHNELILNRLAAREKQARELLENMNGPEDVDYLRYGPPSREGYENAVKCADAVHRSQVMLAEVVASDQGDNMPGYYQAKDFLDDVDEAKKDGSPRRLGHTAIKYEVTDMIDFFQQKMEELMPEQGLDQCAAVHAWLMMRFIENCKASSNVLLHEWVNSSKRDNGIAELEGHLSESIKNLNTDVTKDKKLIATLTSIADEAFVKMAAPENVGGSQYVAKMNMEELMGTLSGTFDVLAQSLQAEPQPVDQPLFSHERLHVVVERLGDLAAMQQSPSEFEQALIDIRANQDDMSPADVYKSLVNTINDNAQTDEQARDLAAQVKASYDMANMGAEQRVVAALEAHEASWQAKLAPPLPPDPSEKKGQESLLRHSK